MPARKGRGTRVQFPAPPLDGLRRNPQAVAISTRTSISSLTAHSRDFREMGLGGRRPDCIGGCIQRHNPGIAGRMDIHISPHDGVPIYLQIVNQVKYLVASGRLAPGTELPAIRVLAEQLMVNPNTVARAYRELEVAGVVAKRRTAGTYVSDAGSPLARRERLRILAERADALLAEARQMNVSLEEVFELLRQRDEAMQPPEGEVHS